MNTERPRLLIVEDDPATAKLLVRHFERDYRVTLARDGEEGLLAAKTASPDLILADVMMPRLDGLEMVTTLRRAACRVPVIFLTAKAQSADVIEGINAGCSHYVAKPFKLDDLSKRVRRSLGRE